MLLAGGGGGYFFASNTYGSQVTGLQNQLASTQQELAEKTQEYTTLSDSYQALSQSTTALEASKNDLQTSYNDLQTDYDTLEADYAALQDQYTTLSTQYDTLQGGVDTGLADLSDKYVTLKSDYDTLTQMMSNNVYGTPGDTAMLNNYYKLNLAVRRLNTTLWEYCNQISSFPHTLTTVEVLKMESRVRSIIGTTTDSWANYQKIHEYMTSNIEYVYDIEFPYISTYNYQDVNGVYYLTDFEVWTITNYVQTPEFTLQYKQGDCDDQAALEYAMIRYYNKYIQGSDYNLYLAEMDFEDGSGHVAVFMPDSGGVLTILDPAGNYLTKTGSSIDYKGAASELEAYNHHWIDQNGSITNIRLYSINLNDGSYTTVAQGTRAQVAAWLAES
jgi:chaperonin cofactor prefoldin